LFYRAGRYIKDWPTGCRRDGQPAVSEDDENQPLFFSESLALLILAASGGAGVLALLIWLGRWTWRHIGTH
jgi:hypothetical protein